MPPQPVKTIDGIIRSEADEQRIDLAVARVFSTPDGKILNDWLRQLSLLADGPMTDPHAHTFRAGGRWLYQLIRERIQRGTK